MALWKALSAPSALLLMLLALLPAALTQKLILGGSAFGTITATGNSYNLISAQKITDGSIPAPDNMSDLIIYQFIAKPGGFAQYKASDYFSVVPFQKYPYLILYVMTGPAGTDSNNNTYSPIYDNTKIGVAVQVGYTTTMYPTGYGNLGVGTKAINVTADANGISATQWAKFVIPMTTFPQQNWDNLKVSSNQPSANGNSIVYIAGFFGNPDGVDKTTYPVQADMPQMPDNWQFVTMNATLANPDTGTLAQWICPSKVPLMPYQDLIGVNIQPYRDTDVGIPVPMNISSARWDPISKTWQPYDMWQHINWPTKGGVSAYYFPHPALLCTLHNADFFEIGNTTQAGANNTFVAWVPDLRYDQTYALAAYATYVLNTRQNGMDTVAFHVRTRPPPQYGQEWNFLRYVPMNCTNGAPIWQCPDHILFKDSQMGIVRTGRDLLYPLSDLEQAYFKANGYLATMDIYPLIQKLTVYSEVNYAIPYAVYFEPWMVNRATIAAIGLPYPPDGTNAATWGGAWWDAWNITVLNKYLLKMKNATPNASFSNINNLFPLPAEVDGIVWETKLATYLGFSYGGSVLNAAGRCGLDANMERALNDTIVYWRNLTDWSWLNETALHPNASGSILQWRGTYGSTFDNFYNWMMSPPKDDPRQEPRFSFGAATDNVAGTAKVQGAQYGFGFDKMYDPDGSFNTYGRIYPPTGSAYVGAKLLGVGKGSKNPKRAYDILMGAFARNPRHHVNCPMVGQSNYGGISGYLTAKYAPAFNLTGKSFYDGLIEHAMFVGTPAAQSYAYGEVEVKNPMQVAFNDILYKNMSVKQALQRACVIINEYTKPPCTIDDMEAYLVDDPTTNKATLMYKYKDNLDCNVALPNSKQIPAPVVAAVPTQFVSTESGISKAMVALAAACMIIIGILIVLFTIKRNAPVIRAASRMFSQLILFGGELTLASVIIRTSRHGELSWLQCFGTYWFFAIGFGLVLGSLLVKSYRVDKIFRNKNPGFRLSDFQLVCYIALIVLGEIVFCLVLQFKLDDSNWYRTKTIPLTDITVTQNSCPQSSQIGAILLYIWNAGIILLAAIYAFRTRNVASTFNENIFTVAAITLISIISIVIVPVLSIIESPSAIFLMISLGTICGTILSVLVFAVPKLAIAFEIFSFADAMSAVTTTMHNRKGTGGSGSGSDSGVSSGTHTYASRQQKASMIGSSSGRKGSQPLSPGQVRRGSGQAGVVKSSNALSPVGGFDV
ncbi:hypothetical protein HDV00_001235 [Rhizophlyctis rosea]|nr:hypothetical protein HDV00_001235 [Rhizophlyctis rosea]